MEYNWQIVNMTRLASDGFVVAVTYNVWAVDGVYFANKFGIVNYTEQEGETYIPYEDLTPEIVASWVQDSLGKEEVEASLAAEIEAQKHPVELSGLPWSPLLESESTPEA
jgi:hypothetical protein